VALIILDFLNLKKIFYDTVASFSIYSSGAPRDAKPITCENCAKDGSAKSGA